jgi:hypothetical protein
MERRQDEEDKERELGMSWQGGKEAGRESQNEAVMQDESDNQAERIRQRGQGRHG